MALHVIAPAPSDNAMFRIERLLDKVKTVGGAIAAALADALTWTLSDVWRDWIDRLVETLNRKPTRIHERSWEDQTATVAATDIGEGTLSAGLYRVTLYAQVTRAASVSSSLTLAVTWTVNSVPQTKTFAAVTGNTTDTNDPQTLAVLVDSASPVTVTATYASVGGTTMMFDLHACIEQVNA